MGCSFQLFKNKLHIRAPQKIKNRLKLKGSTGFFYFNNFLF